MFDPKPHLIKLKGQDYLEVKWRLAWFRDRFPHGEICTEEILVDIDKGYARFRATVKDGEGGMATGTGTEWRKNLAGPMQDDFTEKAETRAIGRALGALGIGTQFVGEELSEGAHVSDAPVKPAIAGGTDRQEMGTPQARVSDLRPTTDQINSLFDLAKSTGEDGGRFAWYVRRVFGWDDQTKVNKTSLGKLLTMEDYDQLWQHYAKKAQVVMDVPDHDSPLVTGATISEEGLSPSAPNGDRVVTTPPGAMATPTQREELKALAKEVGDEAAANVQDLLEHSPEMPMDVYESVKVRLAQRKAQAGPSPDEAR